MKKKILIIGGAGFIGSHLLKAIQKEKFSKLIIFDDFSRGKYENIEWCKKDPRIEVFNDGGNILNEEILNKACKNTNIVFHLAAKWLLHCHEYPKLAFDVNIKGTHNVLEACRINKIDKLIFSSSASVYGDAKKIPMDENHPLSQKNFYGATKVACEAMIRSYYFRYGLNYVGLRYMNVYGERQDSKGAYVSVIMKMLENINKNKSPIIFGKGNEFYDFVNVKDCARANILAMKSSIKSGFYNIGSGKRTTLIQLANLLMKLTNCKKKITFKKNSNMTIVKSRIGCIKKAKKDLNFISKISLNDGLEQLISWYNNS